MTSKRQLTDAEFAEAWMEYHDEVERTGAGSVTIFAERLGMGRTAVCMWRRQVEHRLNKLLPPFPNPRTPGNLLRQHAEATAGATPAHLRPMVIPDGFGATRLTTLVKTDNPEMPLQWVRASVDPERMREMLQEAARAMTADLPRVEPRPAAAHHNADLLVAYPMGDPHIGMRAWALECGEDWDLHIAERVHCQAMADLVDAAPPAETALIVNLGDLFHYDSMAAVTPRSGHQVDADGRYAKMIAVGIKVMRQCITSALAKHKTVHVVNVQGNHDETGSLWLAAALHDTYEHEPRVVVELSPALFHYHRFGANLIGMHHGHTCKPAGLPGVMASDQAELWGQTRHRYWWTGHVHHESLREYPGVTVETFNTLAAKDAYATAGGWRSRRLMQAIVLHREGGIKARHIVTAESVQQAKAA
jgi:UDP-2,3-diacylglucosamine pyrophosphatase LpxH